MTNDELEKEEKEFNQRTREESSRVLKKEDSDLSKKEIERRALKFLSKNLIGTLATCSNNEPRSTPVRYRTDGFTVYVVTEGGGKLHNIRKNPKVGFSVYGKYTGFKSVRGLQLWGRAEIIEPEDKEAYNNAFEVMKFSEREDLKKIGVTGVKPNMYIIKINPHRIRYLSLPEGILNQELTLNQDQSSVKSALEA